MALNVGVIGCGNISGIYLENSRRCPQFNIIACADLDRAKAEEAARKYGIESVYSVEEMIASPDIDMILNLTVPHAHATVALQAIEQKKHVYSEKPLAVSLEDGKRIIEAARLNNVAVGPHRTLF